MADSIYPDLTVTEHDATIAYKEIFIFLTRYDLGDVCRDNTIIVFDE
ncbi:hypothetical protein HED50_21340 [Ochrobactrum oryzae]|nr:hypothetical protein [Brucella oryzae]